MTQTKDAAYEQATVMFPCVSRGHEDVATCIDMDDCMLPCIQCQLAAIKVAEKRGHMTGFTAIMALEMPTELRDEIKEILLGCFDRADERTLEIVEVLR